MREPEVNAVDWQEKSRRLAHVVTEYGDALRQIDNAVNGACPMYAFENPFDGEMVDDFTAEQVREDVRQILDVVVEQLNRTVRR